MNRTFKRLITTTLAAGALPLGALASAGAAITTATGHTHPAPHIPGSAGGIKPFCFPDPDDSGCLPTVPGDGEAPNGLTIRSGPGTGYSPVGTLPYEAGGTVICYATGIVINGDPYWDDILSSSGNGYVSDYWLYTGGNINQQVEQCPG